MNPRNASTVNHTAVVESILFETDGPEIVVARDGVGTAYLSLLVERTADGDMFLCVPASQQRIAALRNGAIDLREALANGEVGRVFSARYALLDALPSLMLTPVANIPEEWLPSSGFLLSGLLPESTVDLDVLATDAIAKHSSVGVLELHPPESEIESLIDSYHLVDGLRLFQGLLHHAFAKAMTGADKLHRIMLGGDEAPTFQVLPEFAPGSFRVHFQSKLKADLSGSTGVGIALAKVDELTHFIDSPEQALLVMKANSGHVVSAYRSLLHFIASEKTPLVYSWSEPGITVPRRRRIGVESAQRFYDILSTKQELSSEEVTHVGTFTKLNEDGAWLLRSGKKSVKGLIAEGAGNLLAGVVYQTKEYRIVCDERLEETVGRKPRTTLYLKQLPEPT
jgi:hypothetical protein